MKDSRRRWLPSEFHVGPLFHDIPMKKRTIGCSEAAQFRVAQGCYFKFPEPLVEFTVSTGFES